MKTAVSITINTNGYDSIPSIHAKDSENIGNKQVINKRLFSDVITLLNAQDLSITALARLMSVPRDEIERTVQFGIQVGLIRMARRDVCPISHRVSNFFSVTSKRQRLSKVMKPFSDAIMLCEEVLPKDVVKEFSPAIYYYCKGGVKPSFSRPTDRHMWDHTIFPLINTELAYGKKR